MLLTGWETIESASDNAAVDLTLARSETSGWVTRAAALVCYLICEHPRAKTRTSPPLLPPLSCVCGLLFGELHRVSQRGITDAHSCVCEQTR